jgi:DNA-binding NarL/FixJ family response regulator
MHAIVVCNDALAQDALADIASRACPESALHTCSDLAAAARTAAGVPTVSLVIAAHGTIHGQAHLFDTLRAHVPDAPIVVVSAPNEPAEARAWLNRGVSGYLPRTMSRSAVLSALRLVCTGEQFVPAMAIDTTGETAHHAPSPAGCTDARFQSLTERQWQVLTMLAEGAPNKVIARALGVHEVTVKSHLRTIYRHLGVRSRAQAAREAVLTHAVELGSGADALVP